DGIRDRNVTEVQTCALPIYLNAIEFLLHFIQSDLADLFPGIEIIDFGGGLGIPYRKYEEEPRLDMQELGRRLHALLSAWVGETRSEERRVGKEWRRRWRRHE